MKKKLIILPIGIALIGGAIAISQIRPKSNPSDASYVASSLFEMNRMKAKTSTSAAFNEIYSDSRKGLKLYSTSSGATAEFKEVLNSEISIDMKSSTLNQTSPNLYHYSLTFTNVDNNESFKFHIQDSGVSNIFYVEANGQKAGFYDNEGDGWTGRGFTKIFNNNEMYTTVNYSNATESTKVTFNPKTLAVYVKYDRFNIKVWDFTSPYIDGRAQFAKLSPMDNYKVTFNFEESKINSKAELVLYSFGNYEFSSSFLSDSSSSINADFSIKAVVNEEYILPTPTNASTSDLKVRIYDDGEILVDDSFAKVYKFTPTQSKSYYVVYYNENNSGWYKLDAVSVAQNNFVFEKPFNDESVGYMSKFTVPECTIESNLLDKEVSAVVTINKKDEAPLAKYTNVQPGFDFIFDEELESKSLTYEFTYSYKATNSNFSYTKTYEKKVLKINETIEVEDYDELYALGTSVNVHEAKVYKDGNIFTPTFKVTYPSGFETSEESINLTEAGFYTITYTYAKGSFTRKFAAIADVNSLFVTNNVTGGFAVSSSNDEYCGYMANMKNNGSITYVKEIDVTQLTKDDLLIGLLAQPHTIGTADLTTIIVTLTDANDPTNFVNIRLRQGNDNADSSTFIRAAAYNQNYAGMYYNPWGDIKEHIENTKAHEYGGLVHNHDFTSRISYYKPFDGQIVRLYFDYQTKALYTEWLNIANGLYPVEHPIGSLTKTPIADFDSTTYFEKVWSGFSSSKVVLSVTAGGVSGTSADVLVTDIYGSKLNKQMIEDTEGPTIDIDTKGNNGYPQGVVGEEFTLLDSIPSDFGSGISKTGQKVFAPSGDQVTVNKDSNGRLYFVPQVAGNYRIEYSATDNFNNTSTRSITIEVISQASYEPISIALDSHETNYSLGQSVEFPSYTVTGGIGYNIVTKTVRYGSPSGEEVPSEATNFIASKVGTYNVEFKVSDYLNHVATESYNVTVTRSDKPLFDESSLSLPLAFINGVAHTFPTYEATYYTSDDIASKTTIVGKVTITDGSGTHVIDDTNTYVPTWSESCQEASIKISFTYGSGETDEYGPYNIGIVKSNSGSKFMAGYFLTENSTVSVYPRFAHMDIDDTSISTGSSTFIRAVNEKMYNLELSSSTDTQTGVTEPRINFKSLKVTLFDSMKSSVSVDINVEIKNNGELYASINDGEKVKVEGSLYSTIEANKNLVLNYDSETKEFTDALGSLIGKATHTSSGDTFNGFPSNEIFTKITMGGVTGPAAVKIISIAGQTITSTATDVINPTLLVGDNYYGTFAFGDEIVLPAAEAYDVLSYCNNPTVTVLYQDGTYAKDINGVELNKAKATEDRIFKPDKYGYYEVIYSAIDSAGNEATVSKNIYINDTDAPTFEINFDIKTSYKVGDKINVLDFTVSDNLDNSEDIIVNIYIIAPDDNTYSLRYFDKSSQYVISNMGKDGKYKFSQSGRYRLLYLVSDSNGNTAVFTYDFLVK